MLEYFTESLVLDNESNNEMDAVITLFTRDFGKIVVKAKSARKITSKLNSHLQPLNFINCRLVESNGGRVQIVDALSIGGNDFFFKENPEIFGKFLNIARFINEMTFEFHEDKRLWAAIKKIISQTGEKIEEKIICRGLLKILGFDPECATCAFCENPRPRYFFKAEHVFLCEKCGGKINQNELVLI